MKKAFIISCITLFSLFLIYGLFPISSAEAKVGGVCYNCHTMHNSQDGTSVLMTGTGTGWNEFSKLSGGSLQSAPAGNLLVTNCVGCHSSTTSDPTVTVGGSTIPIVYNSSVPTTPLAGGNFYWVASDDTKGHNVYGIANTDGNLSTAPGRNMDGCTNSCHDTLADPPGTDNKNRGGCQGCHVFTAHHDDSRPWYRFLKGHGQPQFSTDPNSDSKDYPDYVTGVEDDDWEQETSIDHNWYKGYAGPLVASATLKDTKTISTFCGGCHKEFHRKSNQFFTGIGDTGAWIRHPTDIALPLTGEYAAYKAKTGYSTEAPVAFTDPSNPSDTTGGVVMCLSCHRPHGSDQPDMLRWDYKTMVAGGGSNSKGCFTCHTTKDGS